MIFTEIWQKDRSESLRSAIDSAPGYTRKEKRHDGENTLCIVQHHGNCTGNCAVASGRACTGLRKKDDLQQQLCVIQPGRESIDENETTTVYTGIKSSLEALQEGEHYYRSSRRGEVPIGAWQVVLRGAQCIHNAYGAPPGWHGISFGMKKCHRYYYSGWKPLCADCGEPIEWWNIYMSREAAETIQYMDLGSEENPVTYYYLCPFCSNLEQGVTFSPHRCKTISNNQYRITYDANAESCHGFMEESYHMYSPDGIPGRTEAVSLMGIVQKYTICLRLITKTGPHGRRKTTAR